MTHSFRFLSSTVTAAALVATVLGAIVTGLPSAQAGASGQEADSVLVERGRYLTRIGGCNDCHTPGYMPNNGQVPEADWLTGDSIGWRGPWGTTYAPNLRLYLNAMTEEQWIARARAVRTRPPMPFWALNEMTDEDLSAFYRFVRSLGPKGEQMPAYLPADQEPLTPYFDLVPRMPAGAMYTP